LALILFLHGALERGASDGSGVDKVKKHGPWAAVSGSGCALLAPQCPLNETWPALVDELLALVQFIRTKHDIDPHRIYGTGLSIGAFGVWAIAAKDPCLFAALAPVCGGFTTAVPRPCKLEPLLRQAMVLPSSDINLLAHVPVWVSHGALDTRVDPKGSTEVYRILQQGNSRPESQLRLQVFESRNHSIWKQVYEEPQFSTWLLQHSRLASPCVSRSNGDGLGDPLPCPADRMRMEQLKTTADDIDDALPRKTPQIRSQEASVEGADACSSSPTDVPLALQGISEICCSCLP